MKNTPRAQLPKALFMQENLLAKPMLDLESRSHPCQEDGRCRRNFLMVQSWHSDQKKRVCTTINSCIRCVSSQKSWETSGRMLWRMRVHRKLMRLTGGHLWAGRVRGKESMMACKIKLVSDINHRRAVRRRPSCNRISALYVLPTCISHPIVYICDPAVLPLHPLVCL